MKDKRTKEHKDSSPKDHKNRKVTIGNRNKEQKLQDGNQSSSDHIITASMAFTINIY